MDEDIALKVVLVDRDQAKQHCSMLSHIDLVDYQWKMGK